MKNIILIGFMGSGKSTLGKKLAKKLNCRFIDSDMEIEALERMPVAEIFETKGEDYFRQCEKELLHSIRSESQFVLSTGGGMPCFGDNMEKIKTLGTTFYLYLSPKELTKRIRNAKTVRPLAQNKSEEELLIYIEKLLASRGFFYSQADYTLKGKEQQVNCILELAD